MLLRAVVVMMMAVCCLVWVFEHQPARALLGASSIGSFS